MLHTLLTARVMAGLPAFLALLMISTIRFPGFKKIAFKGFSLLFVARALLLGSLITWCVYHGYPVLLLIISGYIIGAAVASLYVLLRRLLS